MYSDEFQRIFDEHPSVVEHFKGAYPCDKLPNNNETNDLSMIIGNTE